MRKVLVCRRDLLPASETFIKEQVSAYSCWKPVLVGNRRVGAGLTLDAIDIRILGTPSQTSWSKIYRRALSEVGLPPRGAVALLKSEEASLVHVHFGTDAVFFWPILRRLATPIVITLHGYDININRESWESGPYFEGCRRYPKRLLAMAQNSRVHFVAVSEAIKRQAIHFGIAPDRVTVRHIGVNLARFRFSGIPVTKRRRRILYVGRLVEKKGAEFLLRAYARVRDVLPDTELAMVGDGPLSIYLVNLADTLNIPVEVLGTISSVDVKAQIDLARVFCLPSITAKNGDAEGLPIAILEAQASGVPIVTSARGGSTEGILDGITGFAFPEKDVDALSARLILLLKDDELALSMSCAGPEFIAKNFDIRLCTKALEDLYDRIDESS